MTDHNDAKIKMLPRCFMILIAFYYKVKTFKFEHERAIRNPAEHL